MWIFKMFVGVKLFTEVVHYQLESTLTCVETHTPIFLLIRAGAQGQEVLGVEAQEILDQSQTTSWEGQLSRDDGFYWVGRGG